MGILNHEENSKSLIIDNHAMVGFFNNSGSDEEYSVPTVVEVGNISSLGDHLSNYIATVFKFPILTKEEEQELFRQSIEGKLEAAHQIIKAHLRLVVKIALQHRKYGIPLMDLISEGNLGLIKAVEKFDLSLGYRFSTYASWWVRANIQKIILKSWSVVKIGTTNSERALFFNLQKVKAKLGLSNEKSLTDKSAQHIAMLTSSNKKCVQDMETRLSTRDIYTEDLKEDGRKVGDFLKSDTKGPEEMCIAISEKNFMHSLLQSALTSLSERDRDILLSRTDENRSSETLNDLGMKWGISAERVRQIAHTAGKKVREFIEQKMPHHQLFQQ